MNKYNHSLAAAGLALAALFSSPVASATTLTFDDLNGGDTVENGYGGLSWDNLYANFTAPGASGSYTGFNPGTVSSSIALYNGYGDAASISSSTAFTFNSAYLTAAWNDGLQIQVTGYSNGTQTYSSLLTASATQATLFNFDWVDVDRITFSASGGTQIYFTGGGTNFVLDNLTINAPVPEPTTYAMVLAGLAVVGAFSRRRQKA